MSKTEHTQIAEVDAERLIKILAAALHHAAGNNSGVEPLETVKIEKAADNRHLVLWASDRFTAVALTIGAVTFSDEPFAFAAPRVAVEEIIAGYKKVGRRAKAMLAMDGDGALHVSVTGSSARFKVTPSEHEYPRISHLWSKADALRGTPAVPTTLDDRQIEKFRKSRVSSTDMLLVRFRADDERGSKPPHVLIGEYGVGLVMPWRSDGRNDAMGVIGL